MKSATLITQTQESALCWFFDHGADGVFDRRDNLLAKGNKSPYVKDTWSALILHCLCEYYDKNRLRITPRGASEVRKIRARPNKINPQLCRAPPNHPARMKNLDGYDED